MPLRMCVACGRTIGWDANHCPYCGKDYRPQSFAPQMQIPPQVEEIEQGSIAGGLVGFFGAIFLIMGIFLPWASVLFISASGWDLVQISQALGESSGWVVYLLLILGFIGLIHSLLGIEAHRYFQIITVICGLVSLLFTLLLLSAISQSGASVGGGIIVCIIGSICLIFGGFFGIYPRSTPSSIAH